MLMIMMIPLNGIRITIKEININIMAEILTRLYEECKRAMIIK